MTTTAPAEHPGRRARATPAIAALALILAAGCVTKSADPGPGPGDDARVDTDASLGDAGPQPDAGPQSDAGAQSDAGPDADAGPRPDAGPPPPYHDAVAGCVKSVTCNPGIFVDSCTYLYELERMRASQTLAAAMDSYHACLAAATSCAEVDACAGTDCALSTDPQCDGSDLVRCYAGHWVRIPCGEPGSGGSQCLTTNGGYGACADRACGAGDPPANCVGSVLWSCDGGVLSQHDCRTEHSEPTCIDDGSYDYCDVDRTRTPCQPGDPAYCAGNVLVSCDSFDSVLVRYDCGLRPFTSTCVSHPSGGAMCATSASPDFCDPPSTCDGTTLELCFGERYAVDCSSIGASCIALTQTAHCVF